MTDLSSATDPRRGYRLQFWDDPSRETDPAATEYGEDPLKLSHTAETLIDSGRFVFALISVWNDAETRWDDHEDFVRQDPL